jgi:hypothetical protein
MMPSLEPLVRELGDQEFQADSPAADGRPHRTGKWSPVAAGLLVAALPAAIGLLILLGA